MSKFQINRELPEVRHPEEIAQSWLKKAEDAGRDDFDRFISLFVAFNALYGRYHGLKMSEIDAIKQFATANPLREPELRRILDLESAYFFSHRVIKNSRNGKDTSDLSEVLSNANASHSDRFQSMLLILYVVRCNLFHGRKVYTDESDECVMRHAASALEAIVKAFLKQYMVVWMKSH